MLQTILILLAFGVPTYAHATEPADKVQELLCMTQSKGSDCGDNSLRHISEYIGSRCDNFIDTAPWTNNRGFTVYCKNREFSVTLKEFSPNKWEIGITAND